MHVVLRCDARPGTGAGHLVRCLALADAVRRRGGTVEVWGDVAVPLARRLAQVAGVSVAPLPAPADARARLRAADVLHVDSYAPDDVPVVEGVLRSSAQDGGFGRRRADVVVDATLGAGRGGAVADAALVLLGERFAPLRASVREARAARAAGVAASSVGVLVVLGGTDVAGLSPAAARLAVQAGAQHVTLVSGGPPHAQDLPRQVHVVPPQDDLPALAARAAIVLSAAGTTVAELACVGVPTALVAVVENQREGYGRAVDAGLAVGLGGPQDLRAGHGSARDALRALLDDPEAREVMSRRARATVDGVGADRVVDAWVRVRRDGPVARPATADDADLLLGWRNDPVTRRASRSTRAVDVAEHRAWLRSVLADPARTLLVVEGVSGPIGTVRLDDLADDRTEVSLTIAPEHRGRGLGGPTLDAGLAVLRAQPRPFPTLVAAVRPENAASARLFEGAGFRAAGTSGDVALLERP